MRESGVWETESRDSLWKWGHPTGVPKAGGLAKSLCLKLSDPHNLLSPSSHVTAHIPWGVCSAKSEQLWTQTPKVAEGRGATLQTGKQKKVSILNVWVLVSYLNLAHRMPQPTESPRRRGRGFLFTRSVSSGRNDLLLNVGVLQWNRLAWKSCYSRGAQGQPHTRITWEPLILATTWALARSYVIRLLGK